jgi:hypothetical protein
MIFFFLMTIFELVFDFWSFSYASIGFEFEIQTLCTWSCQCTHQGEIEKPSGLYLGLYM